MPKKEMRHIVIVVPGIMGSVLQKDGRDLWAISGQAAWSWLRSLGTSLDEMELKEDDPDVDDLGDGIRATKLIPDSHIVPGLWKIDGYSGILRTITDNFEVFHGSVNH